MPEEAFVHWLLDASTPSIRYRTRRDLLGGPADDPALLHDREAIMKDGVVPAIYANQTGTGQWAGEQSYYTPKYVSTHWSMMLLEELAADETDTRFKRGVEYMLNETAAEMRRQLVQDGHGFSCFWGNMLRYAAYAGYGDDERTQAVVRYAVHDIQEGHCLCQHNAGHPCAWGVVRTLWGLAALPSGQQPGEMADTIQEALTFLLDSFSLTAADYPTPNNGKIHPLWFKLNFPLFYQTDILFTLRLLGEVNALDHPRAQGALDWLEVLRGENGHWRGSSPFRQRTWKGLGSQEETNRWVSLQAAIVLKQAGRLDVPETAA